MGEGSKEHPDFHWTCDRNGAYVDVIKTTDRSQVARIHVCIPDEQERERVTLLMQDAPQLLYELRRARRVIRELSGKSFGSQTNPLEAVTRIDAVLDRLKFPVE